MAAIAFHSGWGGWYRCRLFDWFSKQCCLRQNLGSTENLGWNRKRFALICDYCEGQFLHPQYLGAKDEKENIRIITRRHVAWLTALRYAMRTKKQWEASYHQEGKKKVTFPYNVPEYETPIEDELRPYLSEEDFEYVMRMDNKPNAIINLQSMHLRKLADEGKIWDFSLLRMQEMTALQGKSERIKNFPYPKQYGSIGYHFVHIFMWLLPFAIIPSFASMGAALGKSYEIVGENTSFG